jgi:hypothetical protein
MEIEIFSLADFANDSGNGKMNIIGTFDQIHVPSLPFVLPHCAVATRIRIANSEAGVHAFEIVGIDPDGMEFQRLPGNMHVQLNPNAQYGAFNLPLNISNFKIDKIGKYAFEFYFDGEFRSGLTMHVVMINGPRALRAA